MIKNAFKLYPFPCYSILRHFTRLFPLHPVHRLVALKPTDKTQQDGTFWRHGMGNSIHRNPESERPFRHCLFYSLFSNFRCIEITA